MTEPAENRSTFTPILAALAVAGAISAAFFLLQLFQGDPLAGEGGVGRAVVGQNDALQRADYADFRAFTCIAEQGIETQVLADQRQTTTVRGARFVDDVTEVVVTGDQASATVVYHFEKTPDDKITTPMTFARENGAWKVCSPGPR